MILVKELVKIMISKEKEKGKRVDDGFVYNSDNNPHYLKISEIKKLNQ